MSGDVTWEPLLVLGEAQQKQLVQRLEARAQQWLLQWRGRAAQSLQVSIQLAATSGGYLPAGGASQSFVIHSSSGSCGVSVAAWLPARWFVSAAGVVQSRVDGNASGVMATQLTGQVVRSLVLGLWSLPEDDARIEVGQDALRAWQQAGDIRQRWIVSLAEEQGQPFAVLSVPAVMLERSLQRTRNVASHAGLARRSESIAAGVVPLRVVLGTLESPFSEVSQLSVGDVLLLPLGADERVVVRSVRSGTGVVEGMLGRDQKNHRAVLVTRIAAQAERPGSKGSTVRTFAAEEKR
jgi:flagellar motor switch/type III secretory pathway protein FliN